MTKVRGPLSSIGASGTIGKAMIHQTWKGIPRVKRYRKPTQPNNAAQLDKRDIMSRAVTRWQGLSLELKLLWEVYNKKTGKIRSGYNYFLSEYIHWTCQDYIPSDDPRVPPTPPAPPPPPYDDPIQDGLRNWYKFDEGEGVTLIDSISAQNGTIIGAPQWVEGKREDCLQFNGTSDCVRLPDDFLSAMNYVTLTLWVFWDDWTLAHFLGAQWVSPHPFYYNVLATGKIQVDQGTLRASNSVIITPGSWIQLTIVKDANVWKIYKDGSWVEDLPDGVYPPIDTTTGHEYYLAAGKTAAEIFRWFPGKMDEFLVYNRALDSDEILYNFNIY